jgi:hypothetical protein
MKIFSMEVYPITPEFVATIGSSARTKEAAEAEGWINDGVQELFYFEAGNLLGDDGLVVDDQATLSLDDGKPVSECFDEFYRAMDAGGYAFAVVTTITDNVLILLYFGRE